MPSGLLIIARGVQIGASILLAGIFIFEAIVLRPKLDGCLDEARVIAGLFRLAWWSAIAALLSALLWFAFEVTHMSGLPPAEAFRGTAWETVLFATRFGHAWQLRLILITGSLALIGARQMTGRLRNSLKLSLSLVTFSLLVSLAWIGHPAAVNEQPLGVLGDALHLAAAGIWLGGLPCLAIYLAVTRETASPRLLQRFSTLSLSCVSVLAISGLSNAWLLVGSVRALLTTRYGALLLGKLALFALLLVLGARNRILVRKISVEPGGELVSRLARKVTSEIILGFGVIAIVSWLGVTPPARDARISMAPRLSNEPVFARSPCCDTQTIPCE